MSGQLSEDSYHREASQVLSESEGETPVKFQTVSILSVVGGVKVKYLLRTEILVQDYISSQARLIPAVSNQPVSPNRKNGLTTHLLFGIQFCCGPATCYLDKDKDKEGKAREKN